MFIVRCHLFGAQQSREEMDRTIYLLFENMALPPSPKFDIFFSNSSKRIHIPSFLSAILHYSSQRIFEILQRISHVSGRSTFRFARFMQVSLFRLPTCDMGRSLRSTTRRWRKRRLKLQGQVCPSFLSLCQFN